MANPWDFDSETIWFTNCDDYPDFVGSTCGLEAPVLSISTVGTSLATLDWTAVEGAESYVVKFGTSPGIYTGSIPVGNVLTLDISSFINEQIYYFVVYAIADDVIGADSNEVSMYLSSVTVNEVRGVPLVFDHRAGTWISEQAVKELDDIDRSLAVQNAFDKEESFLRNAGVRTSV